MAKILGTKTFEYVCVGTVPPGVSDEAAVAEILRAVSWAGGILAVVRIQRVLFHNETPEEIGALLEMRGKSLRLDP